MGNGKFAGINLSGTESNIDAPEGKKFMHAKPVLFAKTILLSHKMNTVKLAKELPQLLLRFGWVIRWN